MKTITLQISQNEDYILLLALLQKFTGIKVLEENRAKKKFPKGFVQIQFT